MTKKELFENKTWQKASEKCLVFICKARGVAVDSRPDLWQPTFIYSRNADGYVFLKEENEVENCAVPFTKDCLEKSLFVKEMKDDAKFKLFRTIRNGNKTKSEIKNLKTVQLCRYTANGAILGLEKIDNSLVLIEPYIAPEPTSYSSPKYESVVDSI